MTRLLESIAAVVKSFTDEEPKPPLHVGEVMMLWTALTLFQEALAGYIVASNTTTDPQLKHALKNAVEGAKSDIRIVKDFLLREGVPLPPTSEPKPESNPDMVPLGVKLTDHEIANAISAKVAACISMCGTSIAQSVRTDVALIFLQFQVQLIKFGGPLREMMKKRGWLIIPPYYYPPGGLPEHESTP
ncbi:MAG: DUF3231 family protein [Tumebacillaceae bacterium]